MFLVNQRFVQCKSEHPSLFDSLVEVKEFGKKTELKRQVLVLKFHTFHTYPTRVDCHRNKHCSARCSTDQSPWKILMQRKMLRGMHPR